eukprot:4407407-Pleurochrysis_carterae.AAC.3
MDQRKDGQSLLSKSHESADGANGRSKAVAAAGAGAGVRGKREQKGHVKMRGDNTHRASMMSSQAEAP